MKCPFYYISRHYLKTTKFDIEFEVLELNLPGLLVNKYEMILNIGILLILL